MTDVDLRRALRAVWVGSKTPLAGAARDLIALAATRTGVAADQASTRL